MWWPIIPILFSLTAISDQQTASTDHCTKDAVANNYENSAYD